MQQTQLQRTANQREAGQSSLVELCRYKRAFKLYLHTHTHTHLKQMFVWYTHIC